MTNHLFALRVRGAHRLRKNAGEKGWPLAWGSRPVQTMGITA